MTLGEETLDRLGVEHHLPLLAALLPSPPRAGPAILPPPVIGPRSRRYRRPDSGPLVRLRSSSCSLRPWTGPVWSMPLTRTKDGEAPRLGTDVLLSRNAVVELQSGALESVRARWQTLFRASCLPFTPAIGVDRSERYECTFDSCKSRIAKYGIPFIRCNSLEINVPV